MRAPEVKWGVMAAKSWAKTYAFGGAFVVDDINGKYAVYLALSVGRYVINIGRIAK